MYYVGTQSYPSLYEAIAAARDTNGTVTSQPVGTASTGGGMLSGTSTPSSGTFYITNAEEANTKGGDVGGPGIFTAGITKVDEAGLKSYYDSMEPLQNTFGSYENFKNYSTEYAQVVDEVLADNNAWFDIPEEQSDYFQAEANLDQEALGLSDTELGAIAANQAAGSVYDYLNLDNITYTAPDGTTQTVDATEGYQLFTDEANQGNSIYLYDLVHGSDAYNALTSKYNIPTGSEGREFIGEDGDLWRADWNGSGYVTTKIREIDSSFGLGDLVKVAATMFLTAGAGAAFAAAGVASGALSTALSSAVTQAVTTGEIDPKKLLTAVATQGLNSAMEGYVSSLIPEGALDGLSTGSEAFDNILSTMAMDVARQGVINGEVDLQQVVQTGVFSAAGEFVDFLVGRYGTISAEEQAAWEARIANQTAEQQAEMMGAIERQFGEGALTEALNSMDAELAQLASQTLSDMFQDTGVSFVPDDTGNYVEEVVVDATQDTTADTDLGSIKEIDYGLGSNPPEGATELVNGVYYDENGIAIGISSDATREQILDQFGSETNTLAGGGSVAAHPITEDALAILVGDTVSADGTTQSLQGLSDALVGRGLVLANVNGQYVLISGSQSSTGLHSSLDQDALMNITKPKETFIPPPSSDPNEALLAPTDSSDISQEILDLLTDVENAPEVPSPDWVVDAITIDPTDPIEFEYEPDPIEPEPPEPVDPPDNAEAGDTGTAGDLGAGSGEAVSSIADTVNDILNTMPDSSPDRTESGGAVTGGSTAGGTITGATDPTAGGSTAGGATSGGAAGGSESSSTDVGGATGGNTGGDTGGAAGGTTGGATDDSGVVSGGSTSTSTDTDTDATVGNVAGGTETSTDLDANAQLQQELADALAALETGQTEALSDAAAELLAQITGGDADILQEMSEVQGALEQELNDLGTNVTGIADALTNNIEDLRSQTEGQVR
jgi:hypothetical protein